VRTLILNNCVAVLPYYVATTYIPYINLYFYKSYLNIPTLDVTDVNILSVWS
jgi:hypothetical protein